MSVLISTCKEINRDLTNNSKSKQLFSFKKSPRFENQLLLTSKIPYEDLSHQLNQSSKGKGASIGYGERLNYLTSHRKFKTDELYNLPTTFLKSGPSYSFGKKPMNVLKLYDKNVKFNYFPNQPGPGDYDVNHQLNNSPIYSMKGRNFYTKRLPLIPGPGFYNYNSEVNSIGKYVKSQKENLKGTVFGRMKERRFDCGLPEKTNVGPGKYDTCYGDLEFECRKRIARKALSESKFRCESIDKGKIICNYIYYIFSSWSWRIQISIRIWILCLKTCSTKHS